MSALDRLERLIRAARKYGHVANMTSWRSYDAHMRKVERALNRLAYEASRYEATRSAPEPKP